MNRHCTAGVLLSLALAGSSAIAHAAPLTLVKDGRPNATIIVQAGAPAPVQTAAADLQEYLQKISGVKLPLKNDGKDAPGITLNVGRTATAQKSDLPDEKLNPETYAIRVRGDDIYFAGNYPSPIAFAVYSFLQDQLGVRWFAPGDDWEFVPRSGSTLTVDAKSVVKTPDFSPRIWSGHTWTDDWEAWNLRNKTVISEKVPRRNFQNNMHRVFPPSKYAKTHPEYYPLINGKRYIPPKDSETNWWPCIGNPDVQRITIEYIRDYFKEHPDQDSFSLGMDDIAHMCSCPLCRAMDAHADDYEKRKFSDRFYKFINIVAKEIKKSNPDKYIGTLIYNIALQLPETVPAMESNVFGYIANGSVAQWYQEGKKEQWYHLTREWAKRVQHLSRYDYFGMGTFVPRVFPHAIDEQMKFDKSLGFEGMYVEVYTFLPHTAPMMWSFAQLQWDTQQNVDALLGEFYDKMFGSAAPTMKQYFDLMENSWNTQRPGHIGWVHRNIIHQATSISPEAVKEGLKLLDRAYQQAKTPQEKLRIDVVRGGLQFASYAVLEYDLAQQLAAAPANNEAEATAGLEKVRALAKLIEERGQYWAAAEKRQDLLGANIRGLSFIRPGRTEGYLQRNFGPLESPAIPGIVRVLDWYQTNRPQQAPQISREITQTLPTGFVKDALEASRWLAQAQNTNAPSLLKNGDFESAAPNTAPAAQEDWQTEGAPVGWNTWSRLKTSKFTRAPGRTPQSKGFRLSAPDAAESATLLQTVPMQAGRRYVATVWVKADDKAQAANASLSFRFRDKNGWLAGKGGTQRATAAVTDGWQKIMLAVTAPAGATSASVMLGASGTTATFDDALVYLMPQ